MSVDSNTSIKAADFNSLQSRINQVLGTGTNNFGYGQSVSSFQVVAITDPSVPNGDSVTAEQVNNALNDLNIIHTHQTGFSLNLSQFNVGDVVGADASGTDITIDIEGNRSIVNEDTDKGFNDLLDIIENLENNRFNIAGNQSDEQNVINDERIRDWNDEIDSEFTVTFSNANERRHFFNAGGEIRFSGSVDLSTSSGVSLSRDQGWKDMIENVSVIRFTHDSTIETGGAAGVSFPAGFIGNYDLTSQYQVIFRKDANSGTYSDSFWTIQAKEIDAQTISFKIVLIDNGPESNPDAGDPDGVAGGIQEPVTADLFFDYGFLKANGAVTIPTPTFTLVQDFELDLANDTYVAIPTNQSPLNNSVEFTNLGVVLQASPFNVINGTDTHEASQWYVRRLSDNDTTLLDESESDLTTYTVGFNLFDDVRGTNEEYEWQVRYKGTTFGWTPWSTATRFTTSQFAGFDILIDSDTNDFNLFQELTSSFNWNETQRVEGTITITSGTYVGSSFPSQTAFVVDNIPSSSNVTISNSGVIIGAGGSGGFVTGSEVRDGESGGNAMQITSPVTVSNGSGIIAGGAGGGAAALVARRDGSEVFSAGGGGGAGFAVGAGGSAPGDNGSSGTRTLGGLGGSESDNFTVTTSAGNTLTATGTATGGDGGNPGQSGNTASASVSYPDADGPESPTANVSLPGPAGLSIQGISNITFINGSSNVLGPTA